MRVKDLLFWARTRGESPDKTADKKERLQRATGTSCRTFGSDPFFPRPSFSCCSCWIIRLFAKNRASIVSPSWCVTARSLSPPFLLLGKLLHSLHMCVCVHVHAYAMLSTARHDSHGTREKGEGKSKIASPIFRMANLKGQRGTHIHTLHARPLRKAERHMHVHEKGMRDCKTQLEQCAPAQVRSREVFVFAVPVLLVVLICFCCFYYVLPVRFYCFCFCSLN